MSQLETASNTSPEPKLKPATEMTQDEIATELRELQLLCVQSLEEVPVERLRRGTELLFWLNQSKTGPKEVKPKVARGKKLPKEVLDPPTPSTPSNAEASYDDL